MGQPFFRAEQRGRDGTFWHDVAPRALDSGGIVKWAIRQELEIPALTDEFVQAFTHSPVRTDDRLMIQSVCTKCGASRVVSLSDRSLEEWEDSHVCGKEQPAPKKPVRMPERPSRSPQSKTPRDI